MQVLEVPTQMNFSPLLRRYTLEEFWALPEREDRVRYDLIGGYLFMVPPPKSPHEDLGARMNRALMKFVLENNIDGDVHHPAAAIWRREEASTYLQPDMMYVSKTLREQMGDKRTSADVVFEYLSPSISIYDRTTKADTYLALDVRELWLIDPVTVTIEVRHAGIQEGSPRWKTYIYRRDEQAKSRVLEGWEVSVNELFDGLVHPTDTDED
ncbi:MAG TPA: Uma2 family endonuclease [Pyrinomonadaceae bacterium]|nr:Uma2 family endonuclease [Pyrinomonadaceae bacterium]